MVDVRYVCLVPEVRDKRTVLYFFSLINVGVPHWEKLTYFMTLRASIQSSSCLNVSSCMRGSGKDFSLYGSASGLSFIS